MFYLTAGVAVLAIIIADLILTTLGGQRSAMLSRLAAEGMWRALRLLKSTGLGRWLPRYAGPLVLSVVGLMWMVGLTGGWLLVFLGDPASLVVSGTDRLANTGQSLAYVMSSISTLGASNVSASGELWDFAAGLASLTGMLALTLGVSFTLNTTQTVAEARGFALVACTSDLDDPREREKVLESLARLVMKLNAFPMALYFGSRRREYDVVTAIADVLQRAIRERDTERRARAVLVGLPGAKPAGDPAEIVEQLARWRDRRTLGIGRGGGDGA